MEQICKDVWEKTPALTCRYQLRTAIQKSGNDRRALAAMTKEGSITLPLVVVAGVIMLVSIPCICHLCHKKSKRKEAE